METISCDMLYELLQELLDVKYVPYLDDVGTICFEAPPGWCRIRLRVAQATLSDRTKCSGVRAEMLRRLGLEEIRPAFARVLRFDDRDGWCCETDWMNVDDAKAIAAQYGKDERTGGFYKHKLQYKA